MFLPLSCCLQRSYHPRLPLHPATTTHWSEATKGINRKRQLLSITGDLLWFSIRTGQREKKKKKSRHYAFTRWAADRPALGHINLAEANRAGAKSSVLRYWQKQYWELEAVSRPRRAMIEVASGTGGKSQRTARKRQLTWKWLQGHQTHWDWLQEWEEVQILCVGQEGKSISR